ncbi:MAG TPA: hypothetical protein PLZ57_03055 [Pseudobdellovibrionaceae bacterium]|mgnify:CR=1 FL=1|nr:hypothetical protein [Pseudobdellovibrionaceae bacterium]
MLLQQMTHSPQARSARQALRLTQQLAFVGALLCFGSDSFAQVTFGGVEVAPGLSVGGTTLQPDGTVTYGGIQAGGISTTPGVQIGGATVGGYNPDRQRREDEERDRRRRIEDEERDRRRRIEEDERRSRAASEPHRQTNESAAQQRATRDSRRLLVERGQFQEPFKNLSFKLEVFTSNVACADKTAIDCWRSILNDSHVKTQLLSIQSAERVQEELSYLAQRHAIQVELAERQAAGQTRLCDINDCSGHAELLRHSRRQLQNFKLAYDDFYRGFRVPVSFHHFARRHGITDVEITFRVLLTRDRMIDAMQVNDASPMTLGERRIITNLVAESAELNSPRPNFAIFRLLNAEFPDSIRSAVQRAGFPTAPVPAPAAAPAARPRR